MAEKLALLDGYSLMYRAFHALKTNMTAPDGTPTNAVHGFMMMLLKAVEEQMPDAVAVAFDVSKATFRSEIYDLYKANRKPMPEELRRQDPIIRGLIGKMGIPILERDGFEADDILGTISREGEERGVQVLLVTGDRDSFQLAGENTHILYTQHGIAETQLVTPEWVREKYGLTPGQLIDAKGLMGDASDNIPGVPGVGEKTALKLIAEYGTLENVLDRADAEQKGKLRERLMEFAEQARLSKRLATIDRHAPVAWEMDAWRLDGFLGALPQLRALGMQQAARRLEAVAKKCCPGARLDESPAPEEGQAAAEIPMERAADARALGRIVSDAVQNAAHVSFYLGAEASFATETMCAAAPLGGDLLSPGMCEEDALEIFERALNCPAEKDLYDIKALGARAKLLNGGGFDAKLAAYVLNPQRPSFALDALCREADVAGFSVCPARALLSLCEKQRQALAQDGLTDIYRTVERPLADVLIDMEREGFLIDADALNRLGIEYRRSMERLEEEIYALAGERINLKSPKQLSELLFDRLGLPAPRKRSGGQVSTSAEVLEALAEEYPICRKILDYRKVQKLESTYVGALVKLRDENGRVHSSFDQVATATGRISSLEPNLQNIPVRTELGREIRAAFVARPGWRLVDADYSQIELRVLAHISGDERMRDAFLEGQDIHRRTAKEVYGVPLAEVTGAMRSAAKAVNFGIVYGISDFSLAKNIGVSRKEAQAFIERYFARYPGVKKYMDDAVRQGREHGYVTTLMGRRRYLPELASGNYNVRAFGERCAMNSPIQGTAADIIKLAMIRVHAALRDEGLRARLILQVHDELIVEAPEDEVERVCALVQSCMEGVMTLSVPLKTDISVGGNWRECK